MLRTIRPTFVLDLRHRFQLTMREDFITAVEKLAKRKVIAFMSDNHIDPDMAAEIFVLEPQGDSEAVRLSRDPPPKGGRRAAARRP